MSDSDSRVPLGTDEQTRVVPARWWERADHSAGAGPLRHIAVDVAAAQRVRDLLLP
ncbi:hypothetical protein [Nocardia sp. NPDC050710]|uniref:hypothetical protein n=1 Tax=Nocardia sp. NPDC050710 TaxID=3157220 RepID=UPI0033D9A6E5